MARKPKKRLYGTGTITQVGDAWRAQLPRGIDPGRRSKYCATFAEAEVWLADQCDRHLRGLALDDGLTLLGDYADAWLERHTWDTGTEAAYRTRRRHLSPIDSVSLEDVRPSHVDTVLAEMRRKKNRKGEPLSERYQRLVVGLLSSILMSAVRDGVLSANIVDRVVLPKLPQVETVVLSETEARALLRVARGTRWHAVWWILLAVGLRSGEVRGLKKTDYDDRTGSLRIQRSVRTPHDIGATKGKRERWVPLPTACIASIRAHADLIKADAGVPARGRRRGAPSIVGSPWMFPSHVTGRPYPSNTLWKNLMAHLKAAGITRLRPHDLRHSAATFMIANKRPLPVVAEILGHRSSAFTVARYGHVLGGQHREVADIMGDLLSEAKESDSSTLAQKLAQ